MRHIYFDTNQMYYIRRIADEAEGWEYGSYQWAYRAFPNNPELVRDIRALCYIVALQDQWELRFSASEASFAELCLGLGERAKATREAWKLAAEGIDEERLLREVALPRGRADEHPVFSFIDDRDDRAVLYHSAAEGADVLLTSDEHILAHEARLAKMGLCVMRPSQWVDTFLEGLRGSEDAVDWLERIVFRIGDSRDRNNDRGQCASE